MAVTYHTQNIRFNMPGKRAVSAWIKAAVAEEGRETGDISIVFCSGDYLLDINRKYLSHDYHTDIITFDYGNGNIVSGDLFISVDTVLANAEKYGVTFDNELLRVVIHGIMHLCGYGDKTAAETEIMRAKEDFYLSGL